MTEGRDFWWDEEAEKVPSYCPCERMGSEDPLFILYVSWSCFTVPPRRPLTSLQTSGSTGKPKGVVHSTAGYLLGAYLTMKYVFDIHPDTDKFACMADVGWITGHTYIVYGPLCIGTTTTVFESTPVYPTASRYWDFVDKWKATQLYTAPTAIRLLRRMGEEHVKNHDLSSLRILGTVGEPINPEAWHWYNEFAGKNECAIVDTYWMTETGSHVISPLPGAIPTKPGSATFPFFGYELEIIDPTSGKILEGNDVEGVLACKKPWPSIARTVYKDHKRYLDTYMKPYPGYFFFGDGAARDSDGYIWIKGRVDGESCLCPHPQFIVQLDILPHFTALASLSPHPHRRPSFLLLLHCVAPLRSVVPPTNPPLPDVINVSGHRLSTAEVESALILHKGVAETAVVGCNDDVTGQAVHAFVTMKPEFDSGNTNETDLAKELVLQVRKVIGPFAAPKKIVSSNHLSLFFLPFPVSGPPAPTRPHILAPWLRSDARLTDRSTSCRTCPRPEVARSCAESCERSSLAKVTSCTSAPSSFGNLDIGEHKADVYTRGDMSSLANPEAVDESESLTPGPCLRGMRVVDADTSGTVKSKATPK